VKSIERTNVAPPEPVIFLELAADSLAQYYRRFSRYPGTWFDLGMSFSGGPYRVGDPGTLPSAQDGSAWQPPQCRYRYVIELATADRFRVVAIAPNGTKEYELIDRMSSPRRLVPSSEVKSDPQK
jgi:hypothetical protein